MKTGQLTHAAQENIKAISQALARHTDTELRTMKKAEPTSGAMEAVLLSVRIAQSMVEQLATQSGTVLACQRGCSYCCHLKVEVTPIEAEGIAKYLFARWPLAEILSVYHELQRRVPAYSHLSSGPYATHKLPCAFLDRDGACRIYESRPLACIAFHSLSKEQCVAAFGTSKDEGVLQVSEILYGVPAGVRMGIFRALPDTQVKALEFSAALLPILREALQQKGYVL